MDKDNKGDDKDRSHGALDNSDHDSMAEGSDSKGEVGGATTKADTLAERQMRVLEMSRIMIGVILFFAAVGAGVTTYFVTSREQVRDFETQVGILF